MPVVPQNVSLIPDVPAGYRIPTGYWGCTVNDAYPPVDATPCSHSGLAVLADNEGHGKGWCVKHANDAGLLPKLSSSYDKTLVYSAEWTTKVPLHWKCTIGSHMHSGVPAKWTIPGTLIGACDMHIYFFLPLKKQEQAITKDSTSNKAEWHPVIDGMNDGWIPPHGWVCTEYGSSVPHTTGGYGVMAWKSPASSKCLAHAVEAGLIPEYPVEGLKIKATDFSWEMAEGGVCTMGEHETPATAFAHLKNSEHNACEYHFHHWVPKAIAKQFILPSEKMTPKGLPGPLNSVQWKKLVGNATGFICTVSGCGDTAALYEYTKAVAFMCEKHYTLLKTWVQLVETTTHTRQIAYGEQPLESVLKRAAERTAREKAKRRGVAPVKKVVSGRGVPANHEECPAYFPFVEDSNKLHGIYAEGDEYDEYHGAVEKIGLDSKLPLIQAAAEFYLLMDASLCPESPEQEVATRSFRQLTHYLAMQMRLYIECACLGEARYAASRVRDVSSAKFLGNPKWRKVYDSLTGGGQDRFTVWTKFPEWASTYGWNNLMVFTMLIHETLDWRGGGYGGKKWGQCAKTVLQFLRGRLTEEAFVDTAFGLKHNGNIVFDKLWPVHNIEPILDANQRGDMKALVPLASPEVVTLWKRANGEAE